jgi:ESX secretion system protein EccE
MVVQAMLASAVQPGAAGWADGLVPAGVLVVGGHVPDRLVESNRIVFHTRSYQLDIKCGRVGDDLQVRPLSFDVDVVRVSTTVRFTTTSRLVKAPSVVLNCHTCRRMADVGDDIVWAPTYYRFAQCAGDEGSRRADTGRAFGVMLGKYEDILSLMPLTDSAGPTRIAMNVDNGYAERQMIRRAAAAGERVAVHDETGRWTMTSGSSRIWTSPDFTATPLRPPTLVVCNASSNPYPGARASVAVGSSPWVTQTS